MCWQTRRRRKASLLQHIYILRTWKIFFISLVFNGQNLHVIIIRPDEAHYDPTMYKGFIYQRACCHGSPVIIMWHFESCPLDTSDIFPRNTLTSKEKQQSSITPSAYYLLGNNTHNPTETFTSVSGATSPELNSKTFRHLFFWNSVRRITFFLKFRWDININTSVTSVEKGGK